MFNNQRETNPHFHTRHNDPVIEFPTSQSPSRSRPPPPHGQDRTSVQPPDAPMPQLPIQPQTKTPPQYSVGPPPQTGHQESRPRFDSQPLGPNPPGRGQHSAQRRHHHPSFLRGPTSRRTKPVAWLLAAFCALFWIFIIVGGLVILIIYLVFQPRNPRFEISSATLNAAYIDMGYMLNADMTLLANFTNPNTKVNVDFSYIIFDLYFERNFISTSYVAPFSARKRESRFADVHMVASQVRLSPGLSSELQRQMDSGRVSFEIRGLFRTRSKLGGVFRYSYWLYAYCEIEVTSPPTGVLIRKRCVTRR